jgi:hypothetical protein
MHCDICSVITFTATDLYLRLMNIKASKVRETAKNEFEKCM